MKPSPRHRTACTAVVAVLGIGLSVVLAGPAQAAPSAPSWDDVREAKADTAQAQQTADELSARLQTLQDAADSAQVAELQAGQDYAMAASEQQDAKDTLDDLTAQAERAGARADESAAQVAGLVVELSRTGGGDLSTSMLVDASDAKDLLYRVGTVSHLSERSARVLAQAQADQNTVESIAAQQQAATTALAEATRKSERALDDANALAAAASGRVEQQQAKQSEVLEQLAFLKGTSVATETAYWDAQQAARAEQQLAARAGGAARATATATATAAAAPRRAPAAPAPRPRRAVAARAPGPTRRRRASRRDRPRAHRARRPRSRRARAPRRPRPPLLRRRPPLPPRSPRPPRSPLPPRHPLPRRVRARPPAPSPTPARRSATPTSSAVPARTSGTARDW